MFHKVVLFVAAALMSLLLWIVLEKTYPFFGFDDIIAEGRKVGGMTAEMTEAYKVALFKSGLVSFGLWGAALGAFCGFGVFGAGRHKFIGFAVGILAGAACGALAAYLGTQHEIRNEYSGASSFTYWLTRWSALTLPIALAAGLAAGVGAGGGGKKISDGVVASLIGAVIAIVALVVLVGIVTPVERFELVFPAFSQTRALSVFLVNLSIVGMLLLQLKLGKAASGSAKSDDAAASNS